MPDTGHIGSGARRQRFERIVALAIAGLLAFNYPFLDLFSGPSQWWGIPALYWYLFIVWGIFIGLVAWTLETRSRPKPRDRSGEPSG